MKLARIGMLTGLLCGVSSGVLLSRPASAQVDQDRADAYFREANRLCEREAGHLWGVSLCGPMVFADPRSHTIATNEPAPDAARPRALGYANAPMAWGGKRWSAYVWSIIPDEPAARDRLLIHELFHRVQPGLGLLVSNSPGGNDHLDTQEGRYWLQLEWRALAAALGSRGEARERAVRDALAFRHARHARFPGSAETERISEINEGLAQYTATVVVAGSDSAAATNAIEQLREAPKKESFVRTYGYATGAAYGILLDAWDPGWTRRLTANDDLVKLLASRSGLEPAEDVAAAARRYGGPELRIRERKRAEERKARIARLKRRFVDGPVLVLPRGHGASFVTAGVTPIPGAGTIFPHYRVSGPWGSLEADLVLVSPDQARLTVPGPVQRDGRTLSGEGWTVHLAPGWSVEAGERHGDLRVVPEQ